MKDQQKTLGNILLLMVLINFKFLMLVNIDNFRVLMNCIYTGNYNEEHTISRKRRMLGHMISKYTTSIVNEDVSCETTREREAARLMKIGELRKKQYLILNNLKINNIQSCEVFLCYYKYNFFLNSFLSIKIL